MPIHFNPAEAIRAIDGATADGKLSACLLFAFIRNDFLRTSSSG